MWHLWRMRRSSSWAAPPGALLLAVLLLLPHSPRHPHASSSRARRPFSPEEFTALKLELHTLPAAEAALRFGDVEPLASPPPRQGRIDHLVVLFMENRPFDQVLGCLVGERGGANGIPKHGLRISRDPHNDSKGFVNATCGGAEMVCHGGGGFSMWAPHFKPGGDASTYPYSEQAAGYGVPPHVSSFDANQLPVKAAVVENFAVMNRYFTSVPSGSTPNHLFAQSATSCGVYSNIMYSQCGGNTSTFPQLTIFDSLHLHNVSFQLYMNYSCGPPDRNASDVCRADPGPGTDHWEDPGEKGSPVDVPDIAMVGVGRWKKKFTSQSTFYQQAATGTLPALSWMMPPAEACDHPCHDMAKGDRLLKDVYEAVRAGPSWNRTLLVVVYDDTGGWFDQVVPPHIGVPNDAAPCNLGRSPPQLRNFSSHCTENAEGRKVQSKPFDFRRLGARAAAMVSFDSPWAICPI